MKQHIYACKCREQAPSLRFIEKEVKFVHDLEQIKVYISMKVKRYNSRWPDKIIIDDNNNDNEQQLIEYILHIPNIV